MNPSPTPVEIQQFILDTLKNEDIEHLLYAYFPQAEDEFAPGDSRKIRVQKLIQYCQNRGLLENLLAALQTERPLLYGRRFHHVIPTPRATALPSERNPHQVFIIHAQEDGEFAHKLASDLRQRGWTPWITPESINPGEKWVAAIQRGLSECAVLLVVMTPAATGSEWVNTEVESAIELEHKKKVRFIPLIKEQCEAPILWGHYQRISFVDGYDIGLSQLLATLQPAVPRSVDIPVQPQPTEPAVATPAGALDSDSLGPALGVSPAIGRDQPAKGIQDVASAKTTEVIASAEIAPNVPLVSRRVALITIALGAGGGLIALLARLLAPTMPTANPLLLTLAPGVMIDLVRIPASEFLMGSTDADMSAQSNEKPQHKVTLDEYLIGKYDVTNAQFAVYAQVYGLNWTMPPGKENHPVANVSWDDAVAFCAWVSRVTGRTVMLPTEAQWEKAARGIDGRLYPWGNEAPDNTRANFNNNVSSIEVGKYSPKGDSPYGVADMAGSVWQWTADWYSDTYYTSSPASNPQGPTSGQRRVVRGGGWSYDSSGDSSGARAANRLWLDPASRVGNGGFRVVVASALAS